jgi:hypothetical protein
MASLFGNLPAPEARVRRVLTAEEEADAALAEELAGLPDDEGMLDLEAEPVVEEPQLKRRRRGADEDAAVQPEAPPPALAAQEAGTVPEQPALPAAAAAAPAASEQANGDQVGAALRRLATHIGNPSKFAKAAPLLRQLLEGGTLQPSHRRTAFDAVRAMFSLQPGRHKHLVDPSNRRC